MLFAPLSFALPWTAGETRLCSGGNGGRLHGSRGGIRASWIQRTSAGIKRRSAGPVGGDGAVLAALDLGTNNCRLLVARPRGEGFRVVDAFSRIVRLGEGLGATGALCEAAMDRTIEALKICAGKMRASGVTRARDVATEACRRADNGADFLEPVRRETGIAHRDHLAADEEARLAFAGCAPLLDPTPPGALVFDIGGGSTELVWLELAPPTRAPRRSTAWHSLPVGVVTLAERHGAGTHLAGDL